MAVPLGHERQITFFQHEGHDHDGENSTPVVILPGSISLYQLSPGLIDYITGDHTGTGTGNTNNDVMPVPDLEFQTVPVGPGASTTGTLSWVGLSIVRFMRIIQSRDTECTVTFYHKPTFADEDREFRAYRCGNRFMWEGAWAHFDETNSKQIFYKIENTGTQSATFDVLLKSGTMAANAYARFVESIVVDGGELTGNVDFIPGNGMTLSRQGQSIVFSAVAPETVYIRRWATTPYKPVAYSSSAAMSNVAALSDGRNDTYTAFGTTIQWVMADLGAVVNLGGVLVNHGVNDGRVFHGVMVEMSSDGSNWILFRSPGDNWSTSESLRVDTPTGFLARYIRVWCNGSTVDTNNYVSQIVPLALSDKQ